MNAGRSPPERLQASVPTRAPRRSAWGLLRWFHPLPVVAALLACGCGADHCASGSTADWLVDVSSQVGLEFVHHSGLDGTYALPQIVGSGGALFDYDNDGDLDIYLVNSGSMAAASSRMHPNAMYRQDAPGRFREVGAEIGVADTGYGMGATVGDYDNDGDLDLLVTNFGTDVLYRNNGNGTFTDVGRSAGLDVSAWSTSATFFDADGDGFLDIYIATYLQYDPTVDCHVAHGGLDFCGPNLFAGTSDIFYRNNGDGTFTNLTMSAGMQSTAGRGLGVISADFDEDGRQDVFVANDGCNNQLWLNNGDGTFEDGALAAGVAVNASGQPEASMGVALGDADGNLKLDLFLTHLERETHTLYTAIRSRSFQDSTMSARLARGSTPLTGFGTAFLDVENDGDLDLAIVNGRVARPDRPPVAEASAMSAYEQPNSLALNRGDGSYAYDCVVAKTFCTTRDVSRGLMRGDLDGDGDVDLVVTNCNGPARIYRNEAPKRGHWLAVRALDGRYRRDAVGARIYVRASDRWRVRPVTHAYGYLVGGDATAHFGLGAADRVQRIAVRWADGACEAFPGTPVDCRISVRRGAGEPLDGPPTGP